MTIDRSRGVFALLVACGSRDPTPAEQSPASQPAAAARAAPAAPAPKPPDQMDERMRHCPLALDGATSTGGVRFIVKPPAASLDEARRRAHHIVDFAARKTREGHGGFDGKGGGRMKNCPVVTDDVTIRVVEIEGGVQLEVASQDGATDKLREESRRRAANFPFVGAAIQITAASR